MSDFPRTPQMMKREVSAEGGALFGTLVHLWPYIWPSDRRDLKARVLFSLVLLVVAKLATMAVPFTFKWATDALAHEPDASGSSWIALALAAPVLLTVGYGAMRVLMAGVTQLRDYFDRLLTVTTILPPSSVTTSRSPNVCTVLVVPLRN